MRAFTPARKQLRRPLHVWFWLGVFSFGGVQAAAQCFPGQCVWDACHTPAFSAPGTLWGELEPAAGSQALLPVLRDTTDFDGGSFYSCANSFFEGLDVANGWLFVITNKGFQVWNANIDPANPQLSAHLCSDNAHAHPIPVWPTNNEDNRDTGRDIAVPPGVDSVVATAHKGPGVVIWNTASKISPTVLYQDHGSSPISKVAGSIWATTLNGRHYAYAAIENSGVHAYDLTSAQSLATTPCVENQPSAPNGACSGVFVGRVGTRTKANSVDGWSDPVAGEHLIALTGAGGSWGVDVWDVSNPASPQQKMSNSAEIAFGTALWKDSSDGDYYLAIRRLSDVRIYRDAGGCFTSPGSCSLSSLTLVWTLGAGNTGSRKYVTYSQSGATPFLYLGSGELCIGNATREYLFDVADPSSPREVADLDYWGYYYRSNETPLGGGNFAGFNWIAPRMAKFDGDYLYRAGNSILDVHLRTEVFPTLEINAPTTGFLDQSIAFNAAASHCTPSPTYGWSASGGGVVTGTGASVTIEWTTAGSKSVTVTNAGCPAALGQHIITISDPAPVVTGVAVDPADPFLCQEIQLTALGAAGQPPLDYAWDLFNGSGTVASGSGTGLSAFSWQSGPGALTGTYTAEVTVSNAFDPGGDTASQVFDLSAPPALAFTSGPTYDGAPMPPLEGTVQLHAETEGATEWTWDYGDSEMETFTDRMAGENPVHTYTSLGTYDVTLTIANCVVPGGVTSTPLEIEIVALEPLEILTFSAVCPFGPCGFNVGASINFSHNVMGDPEVFDYDWDGNGTFEVTSPVAVSSHSYGKAGDFTPVLRVRRGGAVDVAAQNPELVIGSGGTPARPDPPSGLAAEPAMAGGAVDLAWVDNAIGESGFRIYRSTDGVNFLIHDTVGANVTAYQDTDVEPDTLYSYQVTAYEPDCESLPSNTASTTSAPPEPIFSDGFESGDTSQWSLMVEEP